MMHNTTVRRHMRRVPKGRTNVIRHTRRIKARPLYYDKANLNSLSEIKAIKTFNELPEFVKQFLKEVKWKTTEKESAHVMLDGKLKRYKGGTRRVYANDVYDDATADSIISIHNHPFNNPPSSNDIFTFLFTRNNRDKEYIVTKSGRLYIIERKEFTDWLASIDRQRAIEMGRTQQMIQHLNREISSARRNFTKRYNGVMASEMKTRNIKDSKEANKRIGELQLATLERIADIYNFRVRILQLN